jgi:inner membrane protein
MDTTTHALAGYMIAKTGIGRDTGKWGTIAGVVAAILPDSDLVLGFLGTEFSLKYHRNLTNSVFLVIPFSLVLAWIFVRISRVKRFWTFFLIGVVEILAHTFLDLMTSYGTMILSPVSDTRFALDWVFIVDFFLVFTFIFPLIAMYFWKTRAQLLARISVILAGLYIAFCAYNHSWALSLAKDHVLETGLVAEDVASIPQPLSPFRWGNYIRTKTTIYEGFVNLIGRNRREPRRGGSVLARFLARYQPIFGLQYQGHDRFDDSPWVAKSLHLDGVKTFYWFARFPVARDKGNESGIRRVEFFDLRFRMMDGVRNPFVYAVDFDQEGNVAYQGFL